MQGSFERDIQRKMDELRLTPSAPVWEKIETEIKPEKKKRRGILWLLFAGLLLVGGGWWGYQSLLNKPAELSGPLKTDTLQTPKPSSKTVAENIPAKEVENSVATLTPERKKQSVNKPVQSRKSENKETTAQAMVQGMPAKTSYEEEKFMVENNPVPVNNPSGRKQQIVTNRNTEESLQRNDAAQSLPTPLPVIKPLGAVDTTETMTADSNSKKAVVPQELPKPVTDTVLKKKVASKSKKWRKEVMIAIGGSNYTAGPLFGSSAARDAIANSNYLSSGGGFAQTPVYRPSKTTAGLGFSAGFGLGKKLSTKWEISFGLQYAYYSTGTKVGDKKTADTTVSFNMDKAAASGFYTNTGLSNYTNRFHALQAPVTVAFQPKTNLPIFVSAGVAYGYLLSTNALTFSPTSNLYYQNKKNYNRHQVPLTAAVQWRVKLKNVSVQAGPFVQYNLVKLQQEVSSGNQHLLFAGLKTGISF